MLAGNNSASLICYIADLLVLFYTRNILKMAAAWMDCFPVPVSMKVCTKESLRIFIYIILIYFFKKQKIEKCKIIQASAERFPAKFLRAVTIAQFYKMLVVIGSVYVCSL